MSSCQVMSIICGLKPDIVRLEETKLESIDVSLSWSFMSAQVDIFRKVANGRKRIVFFGGNLLQMCFEGGERRNQGGS